MCAIEYDPAEELERDEELDPDELDDDGYDPDDEEEPAVDDGPERNMPERTGNPDDI